MPYSPEDMLALLASLAVTVAAASPNPFTLESPTPAPLVLPRIGGVKARPACTAMREVVIPSFAAARRGDARFSTAATQLQQYIDAVDDPMDKEQTTRQMRLSRLDQTATGLLQDALEISKALGDPRIAADIKDPQTQALRAKLQQLYTLQAARAKLVWLFVERQRNEVNKTDLGSTNAFDPRSAPPQAPIDVPTPMPGATTPPEMPAMHGIAFGDKETMQKWTGGIDAGVRATENDAARTFLTIAKGCR